MKLRRLRIENFRQIREWEHSFVDSLDRARDVVLLVGPNGSGKTSILDAIAAAFSPITRIHALRPGLELSLNRIVRRGETFARVEVEVEFSNPEIGTSLEMLQTLGAQFPGEFDAIRESSTASFSWTYPDPQGLYQFGRHQCSPTESWSAFRTRSRVAQLLATRRLRSPQPLENAGAVFTFDQHRMLFGRQIPRAIWEILSASGGTPDRPDDPAAPLDRRTTDPRLLLLSMALQETLPPSRFTPDGPSDFSRVRDAFAKICAPHQIVGAVRDEIDQFNIEFTNGVAPYEYSDLSSGEEMVLLVLIRMVAERIHRSILLVDEIELHQHPVWQRRLFHDLSRMGNDNQLIATTHSGYLRDIVPRSAVISLGDLGENS